jgi:hypothetical protein
MSEVNCGTDQCVWEWNGNAWDFLSGQCPECCSCGEPNFQGTNIEEQASTSCLPIEGCPPEPDPECGDRIFSSIRTNKCCCPCFAYTDEFLRYNCEACTESKIKGMQITISGAEGKYEEHYCEWVWNSETEEWENTSPCPEHFECPEPDQSPPKSEGEIRKTLCDLIRNQDEQEEAYQQRRQAVRKNMCCDNLNGTYFIPIHRPSNRRRERFWRDNPSISLCGSKSFRLDGVPADQFQPGDHGARNTITHPELWGGSSPRNFYDPNYPLDTIFESVARLQNSEDPNDKNFCELQIEWEIIRINQFTLREPSQNERCDDQRFIPPGANSVNPDDFKYNEMYFRIYISLSGNNKPNEFNYQNMIDHIKDVNENWPEKDANEPFINWNPDEEGLMLRNLYVFGPLTGAARTAFGDVLYITNYPKSDFLGGLSSSDGLLTELGFQTDIRGPWEYFTCNNCSSFASIPPGSNHLWYRFSAFSTCCSPIFPWPVGDRPRNAFNANCFDQDFYLNTEEDNLLLKNNIGGDFDLFLTYQLPWINTYVGAVNSILINSVNWQFYKAYPVLSRFGVTRRNQLPFESSYPFNINTNIPDYDFNSTNDFLCNFACGKNIKVEGELVYEEATQNDNYLNDQDPYALITPNRQAYGPNWTICSGDWLIGDFKSRLRDSQNNLIYQNNVDGQPLYFRKGSECNPAGLPCFDSNGDPIVRSPNDPCFYLDSSNNPIPVPVESRNSLYTTSDNARLLLLKRQGYPSGILYCMLTPLDGTKTRFFVYCGNDNDLCDFGNPWIIEIEMRRSPEYILRVWRGTYVETPDNTIIVSPPSEQIELNICVSEQGIMSVSTDLARIVVCSSDFGSGKYFAIGSGSGNKNPVIFDFIQHREHFDSNPDCSECFSSTTCFPSHDGNNIFGYNISLESTEPEGGIWSSACRSVCGGFSTFVAASQNPCLSRNYGGFKQHDWFPNNCINNDICPSTPGDSYADGPALVSWTINCSNCDNGNGEIILNINISQSTICDTQSFSITKSFPCNTDPNNMVINSEEAFTIPSSYWPCKTGGVRISATPLVRQGCCNIEEDD